MCRVRKLGICEAEEIGGFLLRDLMSLKGRRVRVLRRKTFKSSQAEVFSVPEVEEIWSLCGCYF